MTMYNNRITIVFPRMFVFKYTGGKVLITTFGLHIKRRYYDSRKQYHTDN